MLENFSSESKGSNAELSQNLKLANGLLHDL